MVTHDLGEAISISDKIVVLSKRPAKIKYIHDIKYDERKKPVENRRTLEFEKYYNEIWKELDVNV